MPNGAGNVRENRRIDSVHVSHKVCISRHLFAVHIQNNSAANSLLFFWLSGLAKFSVA